MMNNVEMPPPVDPVPIAQVSLSGEPRRRGQIYGESLREKIRLNIEWLKIATRLDPGRQGDEQMRQFVETTPFLRRSEQWAPHLVAEVRGLAEGAAVPFESAFALQALHGLLLQANGCSALGVWGQPGHPTYLAQTADNPVFWHDHLTLLHIRYPETGLQVYTLTFSGLLGVYGVNSRGVGLAINALGDGRTWMDGLPTPLKARRILELGGLEAVDRFIHGIVHFGGENYLVGSPERVRDYEVSAHAVCELTPPRGACRIFHTNHSLANSEVIDPESLPPDSRLQASRGQANSAGRLHTLEERLGDPGREVAVDDIRAALSTHGEHPICRHGSADPNDGITNYVMILELGEAPVLHLAGGPGCCTEFRRLSFPA